MSETNFNHRVCDLPGYESAWVEFARRGYPRKLRREWDAADPDQTLEIILRYVMAWNIPGIDGTPIELTPAPRPASLLDDCEDALVIWLVREFRQYWLFELPNQKNS